MIRPEPTIPTRRLLSWTAILLFGGGGAIAETPRMDQLGDPLPTGAVSRLGSICFLHGDWIHSLAFSPDGKTLVSGAHEPFFRMWDAATGREVRRFKVKDSIVDRVALSADGRLVASSDHDGTLTVWDVVTGKKLFSRQFGTGSFDAALAWTPDGEVLAIASGKSVIQLLKTTSGETLRQFEKAPEGQIEQLVFSPDGKLLLSSRFQKPTCVWDAATGKLLRKLEGNSDFSFCLALSPDGKIAAGDCSYPVGPGATRSTFRLWDVATGKKIRDLPAWTVNCAAFSPDGKIVAAGNQRLIHLMDPMTGKVVRQWTAHEHHVTRLAFSRDGKVLASGGWDQRIHLWDLATGKELRPTPGHRGKVQTVAFTPDGRTVVSGSMDRTIRFWDWSSGGEWSRGENIGEDWGVGGLCFSPDGKKLASLEAIAGGTAIRLWDPSTGRMISRHATKGDDQIGAIAYLPDNQRLAVALWDGRIGLWQTATGKLLGCLGERVKEGISSLAPSPDGKSIAWGGHKECFGTRDLMTGMDQRIFKNTSFIMSVIMAYSPDGTVLAATSGNAPVCFWDVATGRKLHELKNDRNEGDHSIPGLAFSPDGGILATAEFREVRLWDLRSRKEFRRLTGHQGEVNAVTFAPDGRTLVSASSDGTLLVWDLTGRLKDGRLAAVALKPEELEKQWRVLGDTDAARRWQAVWTLAACPQTTSFLSTKLRPVPVVTAERLKRLIANLDDDVFAVRERASHQLAEMGEAAELALREALASCPAVETRRRIEELLKPLQRLDAVPPAREHLRALGGIAVLECLGDKEARSVLRTLACGAPQARRTREAKAALLRLSKRPLARP